MDEIKDKIVINDLKPFDKQVDDVLSGADTTSSHLEVLKVTPPLLRMVGVPNLPILMTAHHVKTITQESGTDTANYHGLGAELVKRLPELISDPVMIMDSISPDAKAKNSVVIVTQTVDKENRPVIGAIKLAGKGYVNSIEIDANVLTSAYGKDNFQTFIERNIEQGSVLYVDKEKSQELAKIPGIQFPDNFATLDFDTIIRKTNAFVNSKEQENLGSAENSRDDGDHARALPGELNESTKKKEEEKMDIPTTDEERIVAEARERARHLVEETGEPHVTIEWSESAELEAGEVLTLSAADKKLAELDRTHYGGTYDKVKLHIDYIKDGKADSYEDCRFDIGDELQGLISHIQDYWQFYLENKNWRKRLESQHSPDYVKTMFEEYDRMANDVAPFLKQHAELSDMVTKAQSKGLTSEEIEEVKAFVIKSRAELNGSVQSASVSVEEEHKENIIERVAGKNDEETPASEPLSYRDKVTKIRDEMAQTLLDYIEQNPQDWQSGWNNLTSPINGKTNNSYRGFNALYLTLVGMSRGYDDPRWVTYNQAKDLGASIKKGEKSSPVLFFEFYDRLTKKAYDSRTTKDLTDEDRAAYEKENVYAVLKYSSVFNASQCANFPERDLESLKMSEEDRANQNELIETIIANSAAPVNYDGGNRAFYRPSTDSIHLPAIEAFNSMQDYYATALHEIAHSTGHASRLHRDLTGAFGSPSYAIEELRAELACVYMQIEQGIQLDGKHIENHAAYLSSWLEAAKNDKSVFFKAASDAQKIADYVSAHYVQSVQVDELELEDENEAQSSSDNSPMAEYMRAEQKKLDMEQQNVLESRLNTNVREWYQTAFPTDELGAELDGGLTFNDVLAALSKGDNIYDVLGAYDSVVRERLFWYLAEIQDKSYEEIYDAWMNASTQQEGEHKEKMNSLSEARAEAQRLARENGEPYVTIEWTEKSNGFPNIDAYDIMPLSVADEKLRLLDAQAAMEEGYYKVKLHIDYIFEDKLDAYENCRFDLGSEHGGLIHHIAENAKYNTFLTEKEREEINTLVEYFNEHIKISSYTSMPKLFKQLPEEEQEDITRYVSLGRTALNETVPFSFYVNRMPLTPEVVKAARDKAHEAGLPFSSTPFRGDEDDFDPYVFDGSMSVEDYTTMWKHIDEHREENEYRALKIVLNNVRNGEPLAENITFEDYDGDDYLINVGDLIVKYGGEERDGGYVITSAVEEKFAELQSKYEEGEHKENNPLEENVKQWYTTAFPNDKVGATLDNYITFVDINESVFNPTEQNANIYEVLGGNATSEVRDRVFSHLAEIKGVTYDEIFNAWAQFDYNAQIAEQANESIREAPFYRETKNGSPVNGIKEIGSHYYIAIINNYEQKEVVFPDSYPAGYLIATDYNPNRGEFTTAAYGFETYEEARKHYLEYNNVDIGPSSEAELYDAKRAEQLGEHKEELSQMERRVRKYADMLKNTATEMGFEVRSDEYYLKKAREEIAEYEQSDEYKQAVREDFPKDFIDDEPEDMSQAPQKPVQKPAQNAPTREWFNVDLPEGSLGKQYGTNTMVKMPEGEYAHYAIFVPTKLIKTVDGKQQLRVASDFTYRLNNDGRQVELTGQELRDSFAGMPIGKHYKRVAPSRAYAKVYKNLEKNVPEEMKALPNWCVYRTWQREDKDKKGKVLKSAVTGEGASSKNPGDWTDFNTAMKYAKENGFAGVSFLLEAKNGITCIDLDECVLNAETGEMKERATKLIDSLKGTYMERSTSGNGVHIFIKDDILRGGKFNSMAKDSQKGDLEVFDNQRVISMTGDMFSETNTLTRAGSAATVYLRKELGEQKQRATVGDSHPRPSNGMHLSDSELVRWIRSSKKASDFDALYSGKGLSGDKSNDDAKLAHILLYFSGGDKDQAFRIMRESGQNRVDKPDSYYRHTIEKMNEKITEYAKLPSSFAADGAGRAGGRRSGGGNDNRGTQA